MRYLIGLILLAFPFAELFLLISLADAYGWWLLFYLVVVGLLGLLLIRGEKLLITAKMVQSLTSGVSPIKTIIGSARNMLAGVLLIIPGVLTDIIAVILLLLPIRQLSRQGANGTDDARSPQKPFEQAQYRQDANKRAANDDVIEGEYSLVQDDKDKN